jgi:hypothetical protein
LPDDVNAGTGLRTHASLANTFIFAAFSTFTFAADVFASRAETLFTSQDHKAKVGLQSKTWITIQNLDHDQNSLFAI